VRPVNLLPPRYRPARASGERPGIGYAAIGGLAVLLLMVVMYVLTKNGINDAHDKTARAQAETVAAQAKVGQLQAYGDFAALKARREQAVASVAEVRFDWERLMREMALVLPHDVYLTTFAATPAGGTTTATSGAAAGTGPGVSVSGCAPSHPGVAATLVRLRKLHNIIDVNLAQSTKVQKAAAATATSAGSACPVQWAATATFRAESAPTAPAAVPARLGGGQ
jgi:Tfp pilus assembly protein PilN